MSWHTMEFKSVTSDLNANIDEGLSFDEASARLEKYGPNLLKTKKGVSPWRLLADQFKNIIVGLLIAATVISFLLGETIEAAAILVVIVLNALLGFITEYRAEQAMDALKKMVSTKAKVLRGGKATQIHAEKIVPGDILILEEGDRVAADGRLFKADNLSAIESSLTGESEAVFKSTDKLEDPDEAIGDRVNMVYMGTSVARGSGKALVVATGQATEMGNITKLLAETETGQTPLEKRLNTLSRSLVFVTLAVTVVVAVFGIITGRPLITMLYTAIALAISAVPEGLPAVATITLAIGMKRMARQKAIIRRLPAVESLGSTTFICTDKTGTITENQMTLEQIWMPGELISISGEGYRPEGKFTHNDQTIEPGNHLKTFLRAGLLSSTASLQNTEQGEWEIIGDPTEGSLVVAADKAGLNREKLTQDGYKIAREIPFSSEEKRMAIYYELPDGKRAVFVKGAPSIVLNSCTKLQNKGEQEELNEKARKRVTQVNDEMGNEGLRVLGLAYKKVEDVSEDPYKDLVFLGLTGILDPPRKEAAEAIAEARAAGIQVAVITGDQPTTAAAIGKRIGLITDTVKDKVLTGKDLAHLSEIELEEKVRSTRIFARVSPENKLDIVKALQKKGEIVAMTGDGVNDAPALKKADVSVSMGITGTMVAREASDMVLSDDNFATIVKAVRQGRVIFQNIKKFIHYLFSCNLSEIFVIFIAIIAGLPVPLLALHLLWLNLVTDVFPALSLGFEPSERNVMRYPPRDPGERILTRPFQWRILIQALILAAGTLGAYMYALQSFASVEVARTVAFLTLAFGQVIHVFNVRRVNAFGLERSILKNPYLIGALAITTVLQLVAVYVPFFNLVLRTVPPSPTMWLMVVLGSVIPALLIQVANKLPFVQEERPLRPEKAQQPVPAEALFLAPAGPLDMERVFAKAWNWLHRLRQ